MVLLLAMPQEDELEFFFAQSHAKICIIVTVCTRTMRNGALSELTEIDNVSQTFSLLGISYF